MCCTGPAWKREIVPDHKFDFVDTRDYHTKNFGVRLQYMWIYILVLKSFLVYLSDIYTAVTMLSSKSWSSNIYTKCPVDQCPTVSFEIGRWIFVGCIIFSFLLLLYEGQKAKKIIASRDISYSFTNVMANHYYSLRSYNHFCFFSQIENSTKKKDDFAFFIFFTFKEWKRVLLADGPRQSINALTLYSFWVANGRGSPFDKLSLYYDGNYVTAMLLVTMCFTVLIFLGSLLLLVVAGILYIPLLCYIRGNLKEYCCHKVDKRITELIKKKTAQRVQRQALLAKKEAAGDFSHLKGKKGAQPVSLPQQPTLPQFSVDDDPLRPARLPAVDNSQYWHDSKSEYAASTHGGSQHTDYHDYPPMPGYFAGGAYGDPTPGPESVYSYDERDGAAGYRQGYDPAYENSSTQLNYGAAAGQQPQQHYTGHPQDQYRGQHYEQDDAYGGYDQQQQQQQQQPQPQQHLPYQHATGGTGVTAAPSYTSHDPKGPGGGGSYAM